jgi:hypothetical protein
MLHGEPALDLILAYRAIGDATCSVEIFPRANRKLGRVGMRDRLEE